jgi:hypothetical protein
MDTDRGSELMGTTVTVHIQTPGGDISFQKDMLKKHPLTRVVQAAEAALAEATLVLGLTDERVDV